uniref:Uncharacterized protein n=1 Tax=Octopus bimaculoides TaxID=37653 RepID=A0A0L8I487_OCTBM
MESFKPRNIYELLAYLEVTSCSAAPVSLILKKSQGLVRKEEIKELGSATIFKMGIFSSHDPMSIIHVLQNK